MDQKTRDRVHLRARLRQNNADKEVRRGLASEDNDNKIRVLQTTVEKLVLDKNELYERVRHLEKCRAHMVDPVFLKNIEIVARHVNDITDVTPSIVHTIKMIWEKFMPDKPCPLASYNFDAFTNSGGTHFTDKARYNHKRVRPDTDVQNIDDLWAMVMDKYNEIEKADTENVVCPSDEALDVILEPITTSPTAKLLCEETLSPEGPLVPDDDLLKTLGLETIQNCPQGSSSN